MTSVIDIGISLSLPEVAILEETKDSLVLVARFWTNWTTECPDQMG